MSKKNSPAERDREALEHIKFYFSHVMNGVSQWSSTKLHPKKTFLSMISSIYIYFNTPEGSLKLGSRF